MPRNPEVNFYLKPIDSEGKSLIYLNFKYNRYRLFFSFGERIKPNDWNISKQRPKKKGEVTSDGEHALTDLLDNLKRVCEKAYQAEKAKNGIPAPEILRQRLVDFLNQNNEKDPEDKPTLYKLIQRFIDGEIKHKGKDKTPATIQTYSACRKHLQAFEKERSYKVDFDTITLDFYYSFTDYLKKKGHGLNSIGKNVKTVKVFMGEAVDLGYTTNLQYKHKKFITPSEETDAVYITEKEIIDLYRFDFSDNKRLEQVRDLFVFGCFVGLRFSDFSDIQPENIVSIEGDYFVRLVTKKTRDLVIIPCNGLVLDIFNRYADSPNKLPKTISNQKFNEYIKEVCQIVGRSETGRIASFSEKGRLLSSPGTELWENISSHTARRSFATNYYLQGFPVIDLMKITGHKTEKAFLQYIKVSKLDAAKRLNLHQKKNWSEKMLRVA